MAANLVPAGLSVGEVAELRGVRECLQWFTREKQWINENHLQLCRVPAPTFLEQQRAEWMLAQLRLLGWESSLDRAGNVIATLAPDSQGPYVALTAHLDTVLAPRTKDEITVESDGRFRGPGVSDNGAGLAALLAVARALKCCPRMSDWHAEPLLVANVGEEGEGNLSGMRQFCKSALARKVGAFLVLDGATTEHITNRRWAAGALKSPSPVRAGIAGATSASATRCTRSAEPSPCSPKRGSTARQSLPTTPASSRAATASTPSPRWRAPRWISAPNPTKKWRNW